MPRELDTITPALPDAALPPGMRLERSGLRLNVYVTPAPRTGLAWAIVAPVATALIAWQSWGSPSPWLVFPILATLVAVTSRLCLTGERGVLRMSTVSWRARDSWGRLQEVNANAIEGVEVRPVFRDPFSDEPQFDVLAHAFPSSGQAVLTLTTRLPSEEVALAFVEELRRVYTAAPHRPTLALLPSDPEVALEVSENAVNAEWSWPTRFIRATDSTIRVRLGWRKEVQVDVDQIADLALVPAWRKDHHNLVLRTRSGASLTLLDQAAPYRLAVRLHPELRRVLRLDGRSG